jgi:hypothetical protein
LKQQLQQKVLANRRNATLQGGRDAPPKGHRR